MKDIFDETIVLENQFSKLVPIEPAYFNDLCKIAFDKECWSYMETRIDDEEELENYIENAITERKRKETYPFIVFDKRSNKVAGSTRYGFFDPVNNTLEIGWTWYGREFRGTGLNKACKYSLLEYGFDSIGANRISFNTAKENKRSRRAIEKIGGVFEGVNREVFRHEDGNYHDLATYSILYSEWPSIRRRIYSEFDP